jgi:two-component system cell cycle sensor histidine kinase/response regulator CckA
LEVVVKNGRKAALYVIPAVLTLCAVRALLSILVPGLARSWFVSDAPVLGVLTLLVLLFFKVMHGRRLGDKVLQAERDKTQCFVTEHKRAVEALRASEEKYRMMLESSPDAITVTDLNGIVTDCNEATLALHGFSSKSEAVGRSALDFVAPEDHERALENMKRTLQDGIARDLEYTLLAKGGREFKGELSSRVIRGQAGEPVAFIAITKDISERKRAEEALAESERSLKKAQEIAHVGSWEWKLTDNSFRLSDEMFRIYGIEGTGQFESVYSLIQTAIYPDDREAVFEAMKVVAGGGDPVPLEYRVLRPDGEVRWISATPPEVRRFAQDGTPEVMMGAVQDITELRHAEQERAEMQAQLLQAQKMEAVGTLAGGIAHDFNNLLATIQGYSELAMRKTEERDALYEDLKQINDAGSSATDLTRQLLLFSRQQPMHVSNLDLNKVVRHMIRMLGRLIGEDIRISTALAPDLGSIKGDRGNLEQVIMNLVLNARDAMPDGGEITLATENLLFTDRQGMMDGASASGRYVRLSVADDGTGMDEATVQRIFEPFFTTKGAGRGTGLGLSVVYGIVKQHGGWIKVQSRPGDGSTFHVYFEAAPQDSEPESTGRSPNTEYRGKGERILVVEDDDQLRGLTSRMLLEHGYEVVAAADAEGAIRVFAEQNGELDLVFSDVVLPDKTALQLVGDLLSIKPDLRVLLSSGYSDDKSQRSVIVERGFHFLPKPYTLPDLLRSVDLALEAGQTVKYADKELQPAS